MFKSCSAALHCCSWNFIVLLGKTKNCLQKSIEPLFVLIEGEYYFPHVWTGVLGRYFGGLIKTFYSIRKKVEI